MGFIDSNGAPKNLSLNYKNMNLNKINISTITSKSLREREYINVFPEYYNLEKTIENNLWHNNQNVLDHVIGVYSGLENVLKNLVNLNLNKRKC